MKRTIEEKKKDILVVATKLFAEKGYEGTTMAEIAKLANVGFGTVATYYDNKETLLFKCVEEPMEDFFGKALQFDAHPKNYEEELEKMTYHHFQLFHENRIYLLLLIHITSQWEKYFKPYLIAHEATKAFSQKIELFIQNGQNEGKIAESDPNVISNAYISFLLGLFLANTDRFSDSALKRYAENSMRLFGLR